MTLYRIAAAIVGLALVCVIVWAGWGMGSNLLEEGGAIAAMPWGLVTLLDLYGGFILFAGFILLFERNLALGLGLCVALFFLGNVLSAAWAVWRAPELVRRLRG